MKKTIIPGLLLTCLTALSQNPQTGLSEKQEKAIEVTRQWVSELFKAENTARLMQLSEVPFAFDRRKVLTTASELTALYTGIFSQKGSRPVPETDIKALEYRCEILDGYIPVNILKMGVRIGEDETVTVSVLERDNTYKVVGFSD